MMPRTLPRKRKLKIGWDEDGYTVLRPREGVGSGSFSGGVDATGRFVESVQRRSRISLFSGLCGLNERAYFFLRNSLRARRLAA
jgi:hypothetical protein